MLAVPSQVHTLVLFLGGAIAFLQVPIALFDRVYHAAPGDAIALRTTVCRYSFRTDHMCYLAYDLSGDAEQFVADCATCAADFYDIPAIHVRHEDLPAHLDYRDAPCVLCDEDESAAAMRQCEYCRAPYHEGCVLAHGREWRISLQGEWECPECAA